MSQVKGKLPATETREASGWKPTVGTWLVVLALTVATALYFNWMTRDAPLDAASLALVAFCWFLVVFGARWSWKRYHRKEPPDE
jgi:hypothetical protein